MSMRFCGIGRFLPVLWMAVGILVAVPTRVPAQTNVIIALDADLSGAGALAGEAIRRGAILAIDEINQKGGVLGRRLSLQSYDHRGNPARGKDNIENISKHPDLLAVLGGMHTPVAMYELKTIHQQGVIFLIPWAAGTPIVDNGFKPNYVFRVSVRDEFAGGFLVKEARKAGFQRLGLLLERTGWGRSNEAAITAAAQKAGVEIVGVEWFNWGVKGLTPSLMTLTKQGAQTILLVANTREGAMAVKDMAKLPQKNIVPIFSHWGITGGNFSSTVGWESLNKVNLQVLQTFSFLKPPRKKQGEKLFAAYKKTFGDVANPRDIQAPVGVAHAYDLVHMLAAAVKKAGSFDRAAVRDAMEKLETHDGVMRLYQRPFTPTRHDALNSQDFILARFSKDGAIEPVGRNP